MAVLLRERAHKQVEVGRGRGLNLPGGVQDVLSCLNGWWLEEEKVME